MTGGIPVKYFTQPWIIITVGDNAHNSVKFSTKITTGRPGAVRVIHSLPRSMKKRMN